MVAKLDNIPETKRMPVLFLGHGNPMNALAHNIFTESLAGVARNIPRPRAVLMISAHWLTNSPRVSCVEKPKTIHYFYGFPDELYRVKYPCPGAPELAAITAGIAPAKMECTLDWGLDHGAWSVLRHMYPQADVPVFELSLDYSLNDWQPKPLRYHYDLGKLLGPLRRKGVLVVGSGNIVHNLGLADFGNMDAAPEDWAVDFDEKVKKHLQNRNHTALIDYLSIGKSATLAVPTLDHYLPMIYTIALQEQDEKLQFTWGGYQHGTISMRCFQIG